MAVPPKKSAESLPSSGVVRRVVSVTLWIVVILCVGRWVIRYADACLIGESAVTSVTGGEGPFIFNVWTIVNGHPLYHNPFSGPATALPLYNYLSYYLYAFILKALRVTDSRIIAYGKGITGLLCVCGSLVSGVTACRALDLKGPRARWIAFLCGFYAWFAPLPFGPYNLMVRADIPAGFFVAAALLFTITGLRRAKNWSYLVAGVFFYLAWSCKQSAVCAFLGVMFYLSLRTWRWGAACLVAAPFAALVGVTLLLGSADYRLCTLVAPTANAFDIRNGARVILFTIGAVPLLMLGAFAYCVARKKWVTRWRPSIAAGSRLDAMHLLIHVVAVNMLLSIPETSRAGGTANFLIEGGLAAVPIMAWLLLLLPRLRGRMFFCATRGLLAGVAMCCFFATGIFPLASIGQQLLKGHGLWSNRKEVAAMEASEDWLKRQPEPLLIMNEGLGLPWFSSGGKFPSYEYDLCADYWLSDKGWYRGGGPLWVAGQGLAATVLVDMNEDPQNAALRQAVDSGKYQESGEVFSFLGDQYQVFRRREAE